MLGFSLWCALCSGLRLSLTLGTAEFIQNLISFFIKTGQNESSSKGFLVSSLCHRNSMPHAPHPGRAGMEGNISVAVEIMLAGTLPHFSSLLISRSIREASAT